MSSFVLAKRRLAILVLVLLFIAGSVVISGWKNTQVVDQMNKYAESSGFTEFLEKTQSSVSGSAASMKDRVAEYLGSSQLVDPLDERPLVADKDPDMEAAARLKGAENENTKKAGQVTTGLSKFGSVAGQPATRTVSRAAPHGASQASYQTSSDKSRASGDLQASDPKSAVSGESGIDNPTKHKSEFGITSAGKSIATLPEKEYPKIPSPSKENIRESLGFRFYSHNVKNGLYEDPELGEAPWDTRKRLIINSIKLNAVANTVIFLQEPLKFQLDDIMHDLNFFSAPENPEWVYVGGGRMNGKDAGEHVPIILRPAEWTVVFNDTFWLNDGFVKSAVVGWDAKYPRIATYATLQHKISGQYLNVVNTHFDHVGKVARKQSAILLADKFSKLNQWPSFIMGDLNSQPGDASHTGMLKSFVDVHELVPDFNRYGHPDYSVTGFSGKYLKDAKRIDYVFAPKFTKKLSEKTCVKPSRPYSLQVIGYGLLHSKFGGVYMSDHRPVLADFMMKSCGSV